MQKSNSVKIYTTDEVIKTYQNMVAQAETNDRPIDDNVHFKVSFKIYTQENGDAHEELGFRDGRLMWLNSGEDFEISKSTLGYLWVKIDPPVDFMTAVKSGKRVGVELEHAFMEAELSGDLHDVMYELAKNLLPNDLADIIINGKWYIKD